MYMYVHINESVRYMYMCRDIGGGEEGDWKHHLYVGALYSRSGV